MSAAFWKKNLNAALLLTMMTAGSVAFAHAHLEQTTPAADSTVSSPTELRLVFSEGIEQAFTKVALTHDNADVAVSSIKTAPADKKVLIVIPAKPLTAGTYDVKWSAVSVDTHKSQGNYSFKVSP